MSAPLPHARGRLFAGTNVSLADALRLARRQRTRIRSIMCVDPAFRARGNDWEISKRAGAAEKPSRFRQLDERRKRALTRNAGASDSRLRGGCGREMRAGMTGGKAMRHMNSVRVPATVIFSALLVIIMVSASRTTYKFTTEREASALGPCTAAGHGARSGSGARLSVAAGAARLLAEAAAQGPRLAGRPGQRRGCRCAGRKRSAAGRHDGTRAARRRSRWTERRVARLLLFDVRMTARHQAAQLVRLVVGIRRRCG